MELEFIDGINLTKKMKPKHLYLRGLFAICLLIFNISSPVLAANMESDNFKLEDTNFNMTGGKKSSENYKVSDTVGQISGKYGSNGYLVNAGFQSTTTLTPFKFSVSKTTINFGPLSPDTPSTESATVGVSGEGTYGYLVSVLEDGQLRKTETVFIPDTQCDSPINPCTAILAKSWRENTAYGFGYNLQGEDIPKTYRSINYFRPFPSKTNGQSPALIMSSTRIGKGKSATITFKVLVSKYQDPGQYQNLINFTAIPTY